MDKQQKSESSNRDLLRYAGWGTQLFVLLALAIFGGGKADKAMGLSTPLLVWILPFIVLIVMIYQLIKDTSKRKDNGPKKI